MLLNRVLYLKLKTFLKKKIKENPTVENSKKLDQILEVNPEFTKKQVLNEPLEYERKADLSKKIIKDMPLAKKEWDKYLNKNKFKQYYSSSASYGADGLKEIGTVGDLITEPRLRKELEKSLDIKVFVDKNLAKENLGQHRAYLKQGTTILDKDRTHIRIRKNLSPEQVRSTIAHEAIHGVQYRIPSKVPNQSRGYKRYIERPPKPRSEKTFTYYLKDLNEVHARKFQRWARRDVNKYRSTLEKTKMAKKLLEEQIRKK